MDWACFFGKVAILIAIAHVSFRVVLKLMA